MTSSIRRVLSLSKGHVLSLVPPELVEGSKGRAVFLALALSAVLIVACSSGDNGKSNATPSPADAAAIRGTDFAAQPALKTLLGQVGGEIDPRAIEYTDLTGDGREEAVVPVSSGGTLGNLAYLVFTLRGGAPSVVLTRTIDKTSRSGLKMEMEDGRLVELVGEYGPEDPLCCPTYLRKTYFRWDGSALQVEREEKGPNPGAPKKD